MSYKILINKLPDGTEVVEAVSHEGGIAMLTVVCDSIEPGGWRKTWFHFHSYLVTARSKNGKLRAWVEPY